MPTNNVKIKFRVSVKMFGVQLEKGKQKENKKNIDF